MRQMLELSSIGATMANLNEGSVARQRIPLPPIAEQEGIVDSIRTSSETENAAFSRLEGEIILLREYRTRLIADVVTGKLDVRELAAGLPEEVASDDAQDATEDDLDLEDEVPENLA
jgi:type I restriction enzyme S subunit